ncbi:MAG: PhnD/SsuA/transferrin family substrate-binding protein [Desulfuromonadales bacterium]
MNRVIHAFLTIITLMSALLPTLPASAGTQGEITIGVLAFRPKQESIALWQPVSDHLRKSLPGMEVHILPLTYPEIEEALSSNRLDFAIINPGYYVQFREKMGLSGVLATLVEQEKGKPFHAFGGVIFTRSDQDDINGLKDLKNKKIAIVDSGSLGGYQAPACELARAGIRLTGEGRILATGLPHDRTISAVLEGRADAGFVRTGVIEMMVDEKKLDLNRIKILNKQDLADFPFVVSTRLYPQWPFVSLPHVKEKLARKVAAALLSMETPDTYANAVRGIYGFTVPADYEPVEQLLRELRLPPYDTVPAFSAGDVLKRYSLQFLIFGISGIIVMVLMLFLAVSNRRLAVARKEAGENEKKYRTLLDLAPMPIGIASGNGAISYINSRFTHIFGYLPEEITTVAEWMSWAYPNETLRLEVGQRWGKAVAQSMNSGAPLPPAEYPITCKDGTEKVMEISGMPIEGSLLVVFNDITERKQAEDERLKLEQQLLHSQKLESLGVLAGGIAHDFNNILMAVIGNADLALMRMNPESPARDNLHKIEQAAARAADLAKQMLAYSGKGKFVVEHINLNRLLEEMLHMLEVSISKKAILRINVTPNLPSVEADATQMRQIVMNLVINASEAIGDKSGVIAITTGCMDCGRNYLKDVWLDENISEGLYVYLEVADTGCGMSNEIMSKIFDPFFTTKFTGRGLGMAAVMGIIRGHKGAIKVYSEPDKGSSFKILLPASDKPED